MSLGLGSILSGVLGRRYTIGDLLNIDPGRQQRAGACQVNLVDTYVTMSNESILQKFRAMFGGSNVVKTYYITVKLQVISDTGGSHTVLIQMEPDINRGLGYGNHVRVYCDCNDFKYRSAYMLNQRDSLFKNDYTRVRLGAAMSDSPKSKTNTTTLCKHVFAALNWLVSNYQGVMQSL